MKAVRIHEDGGPEVLRYEDAPDPRPAPGEVLIRLRAASLNHLDVWVRKGLPSVPKPRMMLGRTAGGAVRLAPLGENGVLAVSEGIETGLAVMTAIPKLAVWATLSTAGVGPALSWV